MSDLTHPGGYDDPNKPTCLRCKSSTWVVSHGSGDASHWNCIRCVTSFHTDASRKAEREKWEATPQVGKDPRDAGKS